MPLCRKSGMIVTTYGGGIPRIRVEEVTEVMSGVSAQNENGLRLGRGTGSKPQANATSVSAYYNSQKLAFSTCPTSSARNRSLFQILLPAGFRQFVTQIGRASCREMGRY